MSQPTILDATTPAQVIALVPAGTPDPLAGQTLAQIALVGDGVTLRTSLAVRVIRDGKSAKNAQKALERLFAGEGVAIPARPEKAPAKASTTPATSPRTKGTNPNRAIVAQNARNRGVVSERDAFALVAAVGRSAGYSIPRWVTAGAKGRTIAPKA